MPQIIVIADTDTAAGFRLGGATTMSPPPDGASDPVVTRRSQDDAAADLGAGLESDLGADIVGLVEDASRSDAAVVAVHHHLWAQVPASTRSAWERRTDTLVVPLPPDDGITPLDRHTALRELLAQAVGYEISFSPEAAQS